MEKRRWLRASAVLIGIIPPHLCVGHVGWPAGRLPQLGPSTMGPCPAAQLSAQRCKQVSGYRQHLLCLVEEPS